LPDKYCSCYTAPEALDALNTLSPTIDVYAIGLILYQAYNAGELPFKSSFAPAEEFPAPLHADYEMAEILRKACHPDPAERWQDPDALKQALISYMQRNGVNDTPIVPPEVKLFDEEEPIISNEAALADTEAPESDISVAGAVEIPEDVDLSDLDIDSFLDEIDEDPQDEEKVVVTEENSEDDMDVSDLSFLDTIVTDETAPENTLNQVNYDEVTSELSDILSQADELVAMAVPEPVVAPEGVSIEDIEMELDLALTDETDGSSEETPEEEAFIEDAAADVSVSNDDSGEQLTPETGSGGKSKKKILNILLWVVIFLLVAAITVAGIYYYKNIYLLPIESISVDGNDNGIVVLVDTDIDESLLSVICSDSHGNQLSAPVVNGKASFANLTPDTAYTVRLNVDGFHRLTGETAASYSTPAQTNVVQFDAVTGGENGSVILNFTLDGPDPGAWKVIYSAEGEPEQSVGVPSHMVTLTGLTIGKEYTFTLVPVDDISVVGTTQISFTASELVYAENVTITSCVNNQLTAAWDAPAGVDVSSWTVRCYNDADYNQTTSTTDTSAVFEGIDPSSSYTVEVAAAGMSVTARAFMTQDAITISNFNADASTPGSILLSWDANAPIPEGGWVVLYGVAGSDIQESVTTEENAVQIDAVLPGASYVFKIQQANGVPVLSQPLKCKTPEAQDFSGYGMTRGTMSFQLCKRPDKADWVQSDLSDSDFTSSFSAGQEISIFGQLYGSYSLSSDEISTLFVIKDSDKNLVTYSSFTESWSNLWGKGYAAIDIPDVPSEPGVYTLAMYFNGKFVTQKEFKIVG